MSIKANAVELNKITQAAKEAKYQERLVSIQNEMLKMAESGQTYVFWDSNIYGALKTVDKTDFRNAGFEVLEVNDNLTKGYKIDWER